MTDLDELMRLKEAATPGPWSHRPDKALYVERLREIITEDETHVCSFTEKNDAEYIVSVCNAVPELVQRIRELEEQCDWLAQAAANAGWGGVRVGKNGIMELARIAVSRAQAERHECPTPEVPCHARDGKICRSDNYLACTATQRRNDA